ncbi:MAG: cell wall metabolism sensor histidine kinase WalK [Clostridiales bacterium]|nr:cell wall metabolism sensor histidine kinase WalK [Clostridiales bacterium]
MYKNVFLRFAIVIILLMVIMLFAMSQVYLSAVNEGYREMNEKRMDDVASKVSVCVGDYLASKYGKDELNLNLRNIDVQNNMSVWVIGTSRTVILTYGVQSGCTVQAGDVLDDSSIDDVFVIGEDGITSAFSKYFNEGHISCVKGVHSALLSRKYAVIVSMPESYITSDENTHLDIVILFAAIGIVMFTAMFYFVSRSISRPIKELSDAAVAVSKGNFSKKIKIQSGKKDEITKLGQSFNAMMDALDEVETQRREFMGNISHELRSPLTSMHGYLQGIVDGVIEGEMQQTYLKIALSETERMKGMIENMFNMSKMESQQNALMRSVFDVNELIRIVIISKIVQLEQKEIEVVTDFESEQFFVDADKDMIQQVIINLVDNAVKFTPQKGKITISTWLFKDKVFVKISDTGVGIPEDDINKIWDRFYQVDKAKPASRMGSGLGLAIVKQIINKHGEDVWAKSEVGKGTDFMFSLQKTTRKKD